MQIYIFFDMKPIYDFRFAVYDLRKSKTVNRKSQTEKKREQGLFPTPIINYQLSITHYFFTTFRMVTPCGTVMRSI